MEHQPFYRQLLAPLEVQFGPVDSMTLAGIIGFDAGGPLNFSTFRPQTASPCITYVSCELAIREEQHPSEFGRYELLATSDDEDWVRSIVSDIGRMTLETSFGDGHTMDIGPWMDDGDPIQGVVFERVTSMQIAGQPFGILRVIGVTRDELAFAQSHGVDVLMSKLREANVYPCTFVGRPSTL
jgi:hypothetical protein